MPKKNNQQRLAAAIVGELKAAGTPLGYNKVYDLIKRSYETSHQSKAEETLTTEVSAEEQAYYEQEEELYKDCKLRAFYDDPITAAYGEQDLASQIECNCAGHRRDRGETVEVTSAEDGPNESFQVDLIGGYTGVVDGWQLEVFGPTGLVYEGPVRGSEYESQISEYVNSATQRNGTKSIWTKLSSGHGQAGEDILVPFGETLRKAGVAYACFECVVLGEISYHLMPSVKAWWSVSKVIDAFETEQSRKIQPFRGEIVVFDGKVYDKVNAGIAEELLGSGKFAIMGSPFEGLCPVGTEDMRVTIDKVLGGPGLTPEQEVLIAVKHGCHTPWEIFDRLPSHNSVQYHQAMWNLISKGDLILDDERKLWLKS